MDEVTWLEHRITCHGVSPDTEKTAAVCQWDTFQDKKEVHHSWLFVAGGENLYPTMPKKPSHFISYWRRKSLSGIAKQTRHLQL